MFCVKDFQKIEIWLAFIPAGILAVLVSELSKPLKFSESLSSVMAV